VRAIQVSVPGGPEVLETVDLPRPVAGAGQVLVRAQAIGLFAAGAVKPPIYQRLPLAEARRAHEMLDAREVLGKLILKP